MCVQVRVCVRGFNEIFPARSGYLLWHSRASTSIKTFHSINWLRWSTSRNRSYTSFFRCGRTIARIREKHRSSRYVGWQMPIVVLWSDCGSDCAEWTPYLRSNCGSALTFLLAVATLAAKTNNRTPSAIPITSELRSMDCIPALLIFYVLPITFFVKFNLKQYRNVHYCAWVFGRCKIGSKWIFNLILTCTVNGKRNIIIYMIEETE